MNRNSLLLSVLLILPGAHGFEASMDEVEKLPERAFAIQTNSGRIAVGTETSVYLIEEDSTRRINPPGHVKNKFDFQGDEVGIGTRETGSSFFLYSDEGERLMNEGLSMWVDGIEKVRTASGEGYLVGSSPYLVLMRRNGTRSDISMSGYKIKKPVSRSLQLDGDSHMEFIVRTNVLGGTSELRSYDTGGNLEWTFGRSSKIYPSLVDDERILAAWGDNLGVIDPSTGELKKKLSSETVRGPVHTDSGIYYTNSTHLIGRTWNLKERFSTRLNSSVARLWSHETEEKVLAAQAGNLSIFTDTGRKAGSIDTGSIRDVAFYKSGDLAVASGKRIYRIEYRDRPAVKINSSIFIGSGKKMFELISKGADISTVGQNQNEISSLTDRPTVKASSVEIKEENSGKIWQVDSRAKAVFASALASHRNASISFSSENYSRDLSNHSEESIRSKFIDRNDPNHMVLADFESSTGVLAAYMAAREGYLPVDTGGMSARQVSRRIRSVFDELGHSRSTVNEGRYISILEAPMIEKEDPVGGFIKDRKDGKKFRTDLGYGNLDEDRFLEASVGRYPEGYRNVLFYRSINREKGEDAIVASEYMHHSWPVVLATAGGGMRSGSAAESILRNEDYSSVTHLVEQRADIIGLLLDLIQLPDTVRNVQKTANTASQVVRGSIVSSARNFFMVVKGLEYAEEGLKVILEYRWNQKWIDSDISMPEKASIPALEKFVNQFLPDRHPQLNRSSLAHHMASSEVIYYSGAGNSSSWNLPANNGYTEEFDESDIPELNNSVVFDMSTGGGSPGAEMRAELIESGASSYVGFSAVTYHSYASIIGKNFLKQGKKTGRSLLNGVNSLREVSFVYSPASRYKTGVREKMENSAVLYGNPETPKDPLPREPGLISKKCNRGICTLKLKIEPDNHTSHRHIRQPFAPLLPVKISRFKLPEGSELLDYDSSQRFSKGLSKPPRMKPLTTAGSTYSRSYNSSDYPSKTLKLEREGDEIVVAQFLQKIRSNRSFKLEESEISVRYSTPLSSEISVSGRNLSAEIYSDRSRNVSIRYSVDGNSSFKNAKVSGSSTVRLENLSYGEHDVSIQVFTSDMIASDLRTVRVPHPLELNLETADLQALEPAEAILRIENPNSFPVVKKIRPEVSGEAVFHPFERRSRKVEIRAGQTEKLRWKLIPVKKGAGIFELEDRNFTFEIGKPVNHNQRSSQKILNHESPKNRIFLERSHSSTYLLISGPKGRLTITRAPDHLNITVNSINYTYRKLQTDDCESIFLRSPEMRFSQGCETESESGRSLEARNLIARSGTVARRGMSLLNIRGRRKASR